MSDLKAPTAPTKQVSKATLDKAAKLITKARASLVMQAPFFGALLLRMKMKVSPGCKTGWTDGRHIGYDPEWIADLGLPKTIGFLAHEVLHCAMMHHTRRQGRAPRAWNSACDYAINPIVEEASFELPDKGLLNPAFKNMSAEAIYATFPRGPGGEPEDPNSGKGDANDPGGCGGVVDSEGSQNGTQVDAMAEREWKMNVAQAAQAARMAGKLPAGLERLIDDLIHTKTPWRDILRRFMMETSNHDFSWARPNRRHIAGGLYLPSTRSESCGEIVVVIDTSGSIGAEELNLFASELNTIRQDIRPSKTYVVWADAEVAGVDEYGPHDELELSPKGGGGTDFRPAFAWQAEHAPNAKALVYLTDMYGAFPDGADVAIPTLWASITKDVEAPFGETIYIEE